MILEPVLLLLVFLSCVAGIRAFIRWSRKRRILDVPNERSSHKRPVPVGAGLVIAGSVLTATLAYFLFGQQEEFRPLVGVNSAYFAGSLAVIVVSWLDDVRTVPAILRFAVHSAASAVLIWSAAPWTAAFGDLWWVGSLVSFVWIVGLTNAYNFMDGIDGIAGIQAVTAGLGWGILGLISGGEPVSFAGFALTAAGLGFLVFNWQPARVFMGDSGSAFLGFTFAALPLFLWLNSSHFSPSIASPWTAGLYAAGFAWPFVMDSSATFLRRLLTGDRVWKPHRKHLYQVMVLNGWSHARVSSIYGVCGAVSSSAVIASFLRGGDPYVVLAAMVSVAGLLFALASISGSGKTPGI